MNPLRLAFSFLAVPRLFGSLLLIPLILSLMSVVLQLVVSSMYFTSVRERQNESALFVAQNKRSEEVKQSGETSSGIVASEKIKARAKKKKGTFKRSAVTWWRQRLIGTDDLSTLLICTWPIKVDENGEKYSEKPKDPRCELNRYDVVVTPRVLKTQPLDYYITLFKKNFRAIHVCMDCGTDIVVYRDRLHGNRIRTLIQSYFALLLFQEGQNPTSELMQGVKLLQGEQRRKERMLGEKIFLPPGFKSPATITEIGTVLVFVGNIAILIVIALWLALKAHRKVLDYLSYSGALLPLVALTGKGQFYVGIWILTFVRVGAFLLASTPMVLYVLQDLSGERVNDMFFEGDTLATLLWLITLFLTLSLATLIASISDLKQHFGLLNVLYRLVPLFMAFAGAVIWGATFFELFSFYTGFELSTSIRWIIGVLPVLGMAPVFFAPVLPPSNSVLVVHSILTCLTLVILVRANISWFAAHLDDV